MTVNEFASALGAQVICLGDGEREIMGGYCGDMLSWVMGRAPEGSLWITIMSNVNMVAVAVMADVSAVLLAEGVEPDRQTAQKAKEQGVTLLSSPHSAYELVVMTDALLKRGT